MADFSPFASLSLSLRSEAAKQIYCRFTFEPDLPLTCTHRNGTGLMLMVNLSEGAVEQRSGTARGETRGRRGTQVAGPGSAGPRPASPRADRLGQGQRRSCIAQHSRGRTSAGPPPTTSPRSPFPSPSLSELKPAPEFPAAVFPGNLLPGSKRGAQCKGKETLLLSLPCPSHPATSGRQTEGSASHHHRFPAGPQRTHGDGQE